MVLTLQKLKKITNNRTLKDFQENYERATGEKAPKIKKFPLKKGVKLKLC